MVTTKYSPNYHLHAPSAMQTARKRTRLILGSVVFLTVITLLRPSGLRTHHRVPSASVTMSDAQRSVSQLRRTGGSATHVDDATHLGADVQHGHEATGHLGHVNDGDTSHMDANNPTNSRKPVGVPLAMRPPVASVNGDGAATGDMPLPAAQNALPVKQVPSDGGDKRMSELVGRGRGASAPGVKLQLADRHAMVANTGDNNNNDGDDDDDDDDDDDNADGGQKDRDAASKLAHMPHAAMRTDDTGDEHAHDGNAAAAAAAAEAAAMGGQITASADRQGTESEMTEGDGMSSDGDTTSSTGEKTGKIVTCPACRLNALPLVKKFVHEYAPHFKPALTVDFVFGKDPVLYLYTDGKQSSKLALDKYSWEDIITLLVKFGIKPSTHNEDIAEVISRIET